MLTSLFSQFLTNLILLGLLFLNGLLTNYKIDMRKVLFTLFMFSVLGLSAQNALHFDGSGDYVQTSYGGILGSNAITVEAWIIPGANGEEIITSWGNDTYQGGRFTFRVKAVGSIDVIRVENKGGGLDGAVNVNDGNWHHVAVTYDPSATIKYKLYVDGVLDTQGNIATALNVGSGTNMRIGRRLHAVYTGYFSGKIDEVRVWNVVRTQSELAANKDTEISPVPASLVAYYQFNQGIAGGSNAGVDTLIDLSANANHGSLIGFTLSGSTSNWVTGKSLSSVITTNQNFTICDGNSVSVGSSTYTTSGIYTDTLTASGGADSIVITDLAVMPNHTITQNFDECDGFSVTVGTNTYSTTGVYVDTLATVGSGCDSIITTNLTIHTIDKSTTVNGNVITANQAGGTYMWLDCDNNYAVIAGATAQSFVAVQNGNYAVVINDGVCTDTSDCVAINIFSIEEYGSAEVQIFPNPTKDIINIQINSNENDHTVIIRNLYGQEIYREDIVGDRSSFNMSNLLSGSYFLELITDGKATYRTFIIKE